MFQANCKLRHTVAGLACALAATGAQAQVEWDPQLRPAARARAGLGLQPAKVQLGIGCGASLLPCDNEAEAQSAKLSGGLRWNLELATVDLGASRQAMGLSPARQGLNFSLVGSRPLFSNVSVYGRIGTTYSFSDPSGAPARSWAGSTEGAGLSFGAGVSMALTPRLSATLGWDSHDLRLGPSPRENVRATSLGLQYRY